jgi:hypothetical protein
MLLLQDKAGGGRGGPLGHTSADVTAPGQQSRCRAWQHCGDVHSSGSGGLVHNGAGGA